MNKKNRSWLSAMCTVLLLASGCLPGRGDRVLDTWETTNGTLKIRIRKFNEKGIALPHNYLVLEAAAAGSEQWRELLEWRWDGDGVGHPIQHDWVQIVSPQVVCAFVRSKYVVTTDAGHTWLEWEAVKEVPILPYPLQVWIQEVHLFPDGNGRMLLDYRAKTGFTLAELTTTDYGVHWTMK